MLINSFAHIDKLINDNLNTIINQFIELSSLANEDNKEINILADIFFNKFTMSGNKALSTSEFSITTKYFPIATRI